MKVRVFQRKLIFDCVAKRKGTGLQLRERRFDPYHSLYAFVAQMVERGFEAPGVVSSILTGGTVFPLGLTGQDFGL